MGIEEQVEALRKEQRRLCADLEQIVKSLDKFVGLVGTQHHTIIEKLEWVEGSQKEYWRSQGREE